MQYLIIFLITIFAIRTNNLINKLWAKIPGIRFRFKISKKEIQFEPFEYDWCSDTGDLHFFNCRIIEIGFVKKYNDTLNDFKFMKLFKRFYSYKYLCSKTFEKGIEKNRFVLNPVPKYLELKDEFSKKLTKLIEERQSLKNKHSSNKSC